MKQYSTDLRRAVLMVMGNKCVRCGFDDYRALQVDHIKGGGKKEAKSMKHKHGAMYWRFILKSLELKENKYQLLCANCNWIKRFENNEVGRSDLIVN